MCGIIGDVRGGAALEGLVGCVAVHFLMDYD